MKKCFKCGVEKNLSEFYKHPEMSDGHLNKCKACTKKESSKNYDKKSTNLEWMEQERKRSRLKYCRLNYRNSAWNKRKKTLFWITAEYKDLRKWVKSRIKLNKLDEIHHWDYNKLKDFFILTRSAHSTIHKQIKVNEETGLFCDLEGNVLDTKQKHLNCILNILKKEQHPDTNIGIWKF